MIKKEMEVGDVFEDGGNFFKVLEVLPTGYYISKCIGEANIVTGSIDEKPIIKSDNAEISIDANKIENHEEKDEVIPLAKSNSTKKATPKKATTLRGRKRTQKK